MNSGWALFIVTVVLVLIMARYARATWVIPDSAARRFAKSLHRWARVQAGC